MMKKTLLSSFVVMGLMGGVATDCLAACTPCPAPSPLNATCEIQYTGVGLPTNQQYSLTPPRIIYDPLRNITGVLASIISLCKDGEPKAELIATQERVDGSACGENAPEADDSNCYWHGTHSEEGGCVCDMGYTGEFCKDEDTTIDANPLKGSAYTYVQGQLLNSKVLSIYAPLQSHLGAGSDTRQAVIDTFYAPSDATTAQEGEFSRRRQEYGEQITSHHVMWGSLVQQKLVKDIRAAATAPVASATEVGNIAIDGRTLDEMLKLEIVDIAMQIELMEEDAMRYMMHQPVKLLTESWVNEGKECGNHGAPDLDNPGQCVCSAGYSGPNCETAVTCNDHGTKNSRGQCVCDVGYMGENCEMDARA